MMIKPNLPQPQVDWDNSSEDTGINFYLASDGLEANSGTLSISVLLPLIQRLTAVLNNLKIVNLMI